MTAPAFVTITPDHLPGLQDIIVAAGGDPTPGVAYLAGDTLFVPGIEQSALEAAVATFDPTACERKALMAYANTKQWALATGGYTITLSGTPRTFKTDSESQGLMTGKALRLTQPSPPTTVNWQFGGASSDFAEIDAADFMTAATAVADFVQATFDTLRQVLADIAAGTITSTAQIEAAAWPSAVSV